MPSKKRKLSSTNTTGYRGVIEWGERFRAQISVNKKQTYLGTYDTAKEAAVAYDRAVIKYNLSKDRLNWPDGYPTINTTKKKRKLLSTNTTGYRGVYKRGERFRARISVNKKKTNLGTYDTPKEAAVAYDKAVVKYNLPKEKLNWPDGYPKINTTKKKRRLLSSNTTGYTGVHKSGKRFEARIFVNKKPTYLGTYNTPKEAAVAYDRAVIKYNLSKDKLNWPDGYPKLNTNKKKRKLQSNNTTGYTGVYKNGKRFIARIRINKKVKHLGRYDTPEEAAVAYDRAVIEHNLSKDKLNFPNDIDTNSTEKEVKMEDPEQKEEQLHEHEQELDWNLIIEQKERPFEKNETTVKKEKEIVVFEDQDDDLHFPNDIDTNSTDKEVKMEEKEEQDYDHEEE
jgi:hypothetical protein